MDITNPALFEIKGSLVFVLFPFFSPDVPFSRVFVLSNFSLALKNKGPHMLSVRAFYCHPDLTHMIAILRLHSASKGVGTLD